METINTRVQQFQKALNSKGCGHLGMGVAGALMLLVFCPMSIVAVAAPYWTSSSEMLGNKVNFQASLWKASTSTEIMGKSVDQDVDMCGEEMKDFEDCGKIHAVRFFRITALLLSLVSGVILTVGFLHVLKPSAGLRRKLPIVGVSLSAAVLLCDILSICIAASVEMQGESKLNGAGFVFLILELLFASGATALVVCTLTRWSAKAETADAAAGETPAVKVGKSDSEANKSPRLMSSAQNGAQKPSTKDSNTPAPAENEKNAEALSA
jgi:hypothetical protein